LARYLINKNIENIEQIIKTARANHRGINQTSRQGAAKSRLPLGLMAIFIRPNISRRPGAEL
jgi:hypothetical protein